MPTAVLNAYRQLTKEDQSKVADYIFLLASKHKESDFRKSFSEEDEAIFKHFTGRLSSDFDAEKAIAENKMEKYGVQL